MLSLLFPKKKPVNTTLKVRKSTQQKIRVLAVLAGKPIYDLTEELLKEAIKKRVMEMQRKQSPPS